MKYTVLFFVVVVSLVCTACTITHPTTVLPIWENIQETITGENNNFPDIHHDSIIQVAPKDKYILLSWTTYLYRYALPHEVHIYGSLIDPNIKFDGLKIDDGFSFSGEDVATIQSWILHYANIRIQLPQDLIGRWYFNMNNPSYWPNVLDEKSINTIDHRLVFGSTFFPRFDNWVDSSVIKNITIRVDRTFIYPIKPWMHGGIKFCSEDNEEKGIWKDHADVFSKSVQVKNNIKECIIYRTFNRHGIDRMPQSYHSIEFYLPKKDLRYTITLFNYSEQEAKQVFDTLDIIE
jgi:hypothetical protein